MLTGTEKAVRVIPPLAIQSEDGTSVFQLLIQGAQYADILMPRSQKLLLETRSGPLSLIVRQRDIFEELAI